MPVHFRFVNKKYERVPLKEVDELMCMHFNRPAHPERYYYDWLQYLGLALGCKPLPVIKAGFEKDLEADPEDLFTKRMLEIVTFLNDNFIVESWYSASKG